MLMIAIFGRKNSGKTYMIEKIISSLKNRKIVAIKNIHDPDFQIDYPGKDTFRIYNAGAKLIAGISQKKIAIIFRNEGFDFEEITNTLINFTKNFIKPDVVIFEGFHQFLRNRKDVYKVILIKDEEDIKYFKKSIKDPKIYVKSINFELNDSLEENLIDFNEGIKTIIRYIIEKLRETKIKSHHLKRAL